MEFIKSGDTIILDCGTTIFELSKKIAQQSTIEDLMIATNDLRAAIELADQPNVSLIVIGGSVRKKNYSLVGFFGENVLKQIHADVSFLSVDAIDLEHGFASFCTEEMGIKRTMLHAAREVVVLADHTKFDTIAFVKISNLTDVDCIITGSELEDHIVKKIRAMGIKLILV
ncbi:Glucitol operon repressor [bioreactor metagenome]|uniref:Glucitol operon repressor n=1 Tax=bioreactor metagenome TaxID=1076179 RepID=A0A645HQP4_9ZZZZ